MSERWKLHRRRVEFGRQELELWMFVSCKFENGGWVVSEEPFNDGENDQYYSSAIQEYKESKERVLFEGFSYDKMGFAYSTTQDECGFDEEYMENKTIETLVKFNLTLTESAKKQIYGI